MKRFKDVFGWNTQGSLVTHGNWNKLAWFKFFVCIVLAFFLSAVGGMLVISFQVTMDIVFLFNNCQCLNIFKRASVSFGCFYDFHLGLLWYHSLRLLAILAHFFKILIKIDQILRGSGNLHFLGTALLNRLDSVFLVWARLLQKWQISVELLVLFI